MAAYAPFPPDGLDDPAWAGGFHPDTALTLATMGPRERQLVIARLRLGEPICAPTVSWRRQNLALLEDLNVVVGSWRLQKSTMQIRFKFWGSDNPPIIFSLLPSFNSRSFKASKMMVRMLGRRLLAHLEDGTRLFGDGVSW